MTNKLIQGLKRMNFRLNASPFTIILLMLFLGFAPEWYAFARKIHYIQDSELCEGVVVQKEYMHNVLLQRMTYLYEYDGKYYLAQKNAEWTPDVGDTITLLVSKAKPEISVEY